MKVSRENKDALNAVIKVEVAQADYSQAVEKSLQNIRKNANIPGFRKGMVPASVIQKQYGAMTMAEEINKLVNNAVDEYIRNEKLDIFGQPLPLPQNIDWETAKDFSFEFEIGIIPQVTVKPEDASKKVVSYHKGEPGIYRRPYRFAGQTFRQNDRDRGGGEKIRRGSYDRGQG